jgi:hypothetical protein
MRKQATVWKPKLLLHFYYEPRTLTSAQSHLQRLTPGNLQFANSLIFDTGRFASCSTVLAGGCDTPIFLKKIF